MHWKIISFETLDSTNLEAKRMIQNRTAEESLHGIIITAEQQTNGKGRLGRSWNSPAEAGLWFTVILKPNIAIEQASLFSFVAAVSVVEAIQQFTTLSVKLKWPNDVLLNGKKLCGILLDLIPHNKTEYHLAIGIGINVNQQIETFPLELQETATSLAIVTQQNIDRSELLTAVAEKLYTNCILLETHGFSLLRDKWMSYNCIIGQEVSIQQHGKELYHGIAENLAIDGSLLVRTPNGLQTVFAGDVSLRTKNSDSAF